MATHREKATEVNRHYFGDPRKWKKHERKINPPVQLAYYEGECAAMVSMYETRNNPYKLGRRHDAWEQGFSLSHMDANDEPYYS